LNLTSSISAITGQAFKMDQRIKHIQTI